MSVEGMQTNAWAFLNICHPVCAWATYRGALVPTPNDPGFVSLWVASHLRAGRSAWLETEIALEQTRLRDTPDRTSRLTGMYCFGEKESAERSLKWGLAQFNPEFFAELHVEGGLNADHRIDANWITFVHTGGHPEDWMSRYWAGEPMPDKQPIWEYLAATTTHVMGTQLREAAYKLLKATYPRSIQLLETARIGAWLGSSLGSISCFLSGSVNGEEIDGHYHIDMKDGDDPKFIEAVGKLITDGHPVRRCDFTEETSFVTPDLSPLAFKVSKADYPFIRWEAAANNPEGASQ